MNDTTNRLRMRLAQAILFALLASTVVTRPHQALARQDTPKPAPAPAGTSQAQDRGSAILAAAVDAAGGAALNKIESAELTARKPQPAVRQGVVEAELQYSLAFPARMRLEESVIQTWLKGGSSGYSSGGPITPQQPEEVRTLVSTEAYDGNTGWAKSPEGTRDLPLDDAARFRMDLVGGLGLMRHAAEGKLQAAFAGEEELLGSKALVLQVASPVAMKLYFDPETHLLVAVRFRQKTPEGLSDTLQSWSDFRRVSFKSAGKEENIRFPFLWTSYRDGKKYLEEKVKKVKLNTRPNPKIFAKPN